MTSDRDRILAAYGRWTALSALRSGSPVKSRRKIYPLLADARFACVMGPSADPIRADEFNDWHRTTCHELHLDEPSLCIGWAAKLVNVYLKTVAYVGMAGRPGLAEVIHPPLDNLLWNSVTRYCRDQRIDLAGAAFTGIGALESYSEYCLIIDLCRRVARHRGGSLVEVDALWTGADLAPSA